MKVVLFIIHYAIINLREEQEHVSTGAQEYRGIT